MSAYLTPSVNRSAPSERSEWYTQVILLGLLGGAHQGPPSLCSELAPVVGTDKRPPKGTNGRKFANEQPLAVDGGGTPWTVEKLRVNIDACLACETTNRRQSLGSSVDRFPGRFRVPDMLAK
ncbi:hypothetical protein CGRA01v4_02421 [Colletotrichum graminicola]|uniref:Uncharacterized protein n=1 Tax=Colletotrichum graminicola (strain M1.001 / M2 / FGSC 10212) TaxID=645133 RepID=E3Q3F8_COLGM|nr:uncharacterized protein GLRG_00704 [Colletotrichum graminicola M1.001]EFQ25560.1 hypothetical protein GLRG_00704 [Colletotrichum graminicola M1.001]WDK11142.1 hypothetical protein CGRA01v4_02421 [Colletotrichum graminicola]